jgi:diguanylate cyclase (GGDEF)-like protein
MDSLITDNLQRHLRENTESVLYAVIDDESILVECNKLYRKLLKKSIGTKLDEDITGIVKQPELRIINGMPFEMYKYRLSNGWLFIGEKSLMDHGEIVSTLSKMTDDLTNTVREVNKKKNELTTANQRITELMNKDTLTNLHNRRYFFDQITDFENKRDKAASDKIIIVMADIDNFKSVNDTYGHSFGDKVLKVLAGILTESIRKNDIVARFGGEEFILCIFSDDIQNAVNIAQRIRKRFNETEFEYSGLKVTASFGVAAAFPGEEITSVIKRADDALYKSKREGKNRVSVI